jgi:hypothetical protein
MTNKKAAGKAPKKKGGTTLEKRLKELDNILSDEKYQNQAYKKEIAVSIEGTLFADFVNTQHNNQQILGKVHQNLTALGP